MDMKVVLVFLSLTMGVLVIAGYIILYLVSPHARKHIEQPKHRMLEDDARLWPR